MAGVSMSRADAWASLFSDRVLVLDGAIEDHQAPLVGDEIGLTKSMLPSRRAEFTAGRTFARQAFRALGVRLTELLSDAQGAPLWPPGTTGSITHIRSQELAYCAVAVSADPGIRSVGLDAESCRPLKRALWSRVFTPTERIKLEDFQKQAVHCVDRLFLSAKECAYKCQYARTGQVLEFADMEIDLCPGEGTFKARVTGSEHGDLADKGFGGRYSVAGDLILTAMEC